MSARYLGLMSGTSMDGLDIVLADFVPRPQLHAHHHFPLPARLADQLDALTRSQANEMHLAAQLDRQFAEFCADCVLTFLAQQNISIEAIRAIGSHGQTIRHAPAAATPYTVQIGDPNTLAALTGIDVVADFRRKDVALGGQGAPLVPAVHHALFAEPNTARVVLNLGGIANLTWLPGQASDVLGFDTGPANTLLDFWWQAQHPNASKTYDVDGAFAQQGTVQAEVLEQLLADPFFLQPPPKSSGRDYFHLGWLQQQVAQLDRYAPADIQRTLVELTAITVAKAMSTWLPARPQQVFVAGGGTFNPVLMEALRQHLADSQVHSIAELGMHPQHLEAFAFAWLAHAYMEKIPGNLPAVTGARRSAVLGGLYSAN
ncbi:anhydro-N-acetylmuramic acid kinase [Pseudidiomarina aestuarii]|uniref:Anhydro-N-acetylmuramic acid kinase n=1 Tax=Pseudidiomarina aestuarii TaxID=624146 RepID=A0A7Z7EST4_9GAMM|nr:anhydro-N-acetylmuramic acid kinase [Pseudidiomarina aestuarii]RUO38046.1 anhydro-N-acetylmuramic acid kinase [Pseudidiomarina aestuarii]